MLETVIHANQILLFIKSFLRSSSWGLNQWPLLWVWNLSCFKRSRVQEHLSCKSCSQFQTQHKVVNILFNNIICNLSSYVLKNVPFITSSCLFSISTYPHYFNNCNSFGLTAGIFRLQFGLLTNSMLNIDICLIKSNIPALVKSKSILNNSLDITFQFICNKISQQW